MESRATTASTPAQTCPFCGEAAGPEHAPAPQCAFAAQASCPLLGDSQETVALPLPAEAQVPAIAGDGFPAVDDLVGTHLGLYRIDTAIGHGSMGRVYRAQHLGLGRTSALKVLSPGLVTRQPQTVERFWAEARAVAGVVHPNIVTVHNLGSDRGYHFIEMEHVPGGNSLKEALIREGAFEPLRATVLVRQVVLALAAAHRAGLVHHDVKPANVLLTPEGQAKLADFGLVRRIADDGTPGATVAGTPTFMAPELFNGAPASPRTDLYAVGVMFFYLLTARLPFAADRLDQLIRMHRQEPAPDPRRLAPGIPDELATLILRLLSKDPADRPGSADELAEALRVVMGQLRDTESLVREALEGLDCLIQQGARDAFRVIVPVPGDRLHEVYIELVEGKQERLLSVYSVCAPADPSFYEFALRLNAKLTYGSLSIREVNDAPMFVMDRTYARVHVTAGDIRAAVVEIARRGDWVEQQLTSTDLF